MHVGISFYADVKAALKGLDDLKRSVSSLNHLVNKHADTFRKAGLAITGALSGMVYQGAAYGGTINDIAGATGLAAETVSTLGYQLAQTGSSIEAIRPALRGMAAGLNEAANEGTPAWHAAQRLGISVTDSSGRMKSLTTILPELADALRGVKNEFERTQIQTELLGRGGMALGPLLSLTSGELKQLEEQSRKVGATIDDLKADRLDTVDDSFENIRAAVRGLSMELTDVFARDIQTATDRVAGFIAKWKELPEPTKRFQVEALATGGITALLISRFSAMKAVLGAAVGPLSLITAMLAGQRIAAAGAEAASKNAMDSMLEASNPLAKAWWTLTSASTAATAAYYRHGVSIDGLNAFLKILRDGFVNAAIAAAAADDALGAIGTNAEDTGNKALTAAKKLELYRKKLLSLVPAIMTLSPELRQFELGLASIEARMGGIKEAAGPAFVESVSTSVAAAPFDNAVSAIERFDTALHRARADFGEFLMNEAPNAAMAFTSIADELFTKMAESSGKFLGTLKKAMAAFLRETLMAYVRSKMQELLAARITAIGEALMKGQLKWSELAKIPLIMAAYGAAVAGLSRLKSFKESAIVTRGGEMTGTFHRGDVILGPDAVANLLAGGAGGPSVMVNVTIEGGVNMDRPALAFEMRQLADMIARQWRRG